MIEITNRQAFNILVFVVSLFAIGLWTSLSYLIVFGNEGGMTDDPIGIIGYCSFVVLRFPTHNLIWLKPELIGQLFIPGLIVNIFIYASLTTFIVSRLKSRKEAK